MDLATTPGRLTWYASTARHAPSKHNTQPWRFVVGASNLEIWPDASRRLTASDRTGRELVISCGAAAQTAVVAAAALGYRLEALPWPDGPDGPVARLREAGRVPSTNHACRLLVAVLRRHTDRGPLDGGALPPSLPVSLRNTAAEHGCSIQLVTGEGNRRTFARLLAESNRQLSREVEVGEELRRWLRLPGDDATDGVPATATRAPHAADTTEFAQRGFSVPGVTPAHERDGIEAPLLAVLYTADDRPLDWFRSGRALMALLLEVTAAGGNASFLNQPVELPHTRELLRTELRIAGHPQLVLRMGRGGDVDPTPRRSLEDLLRNEPDPATVGPA